MIDVGWPAERLSGNISTLYRALPLRERPDAAAADGFAHIETWWPFAPDETPSSGDVERFGLAVERAGVQVASLGFSSGSRADGERGLPALFCGRDRLGRHAPIALDLAERVGCSLLNLLYGRRDPRVELAEQRNQADDAVAFVAEKAAERGMRVMVEPLSRSDGPGYLVSSVSEAIAVCASVEARCGVPIGICFDVFQLYPQEADLAVSAARALPWIRHVQLADWPGRRPPGTGEIDIPAVLAALGTGGYRGLVGLEYIPEAPDPSDPAAAAADRGHMNGTRRRDDERTPGDG
ncbi:TIM barrel protein [Microbacterium ulmi]|uniref:TIM barrel protein n=1 Tax=Microbacterium ulmi TaxID=179095 RepID=A0A7Y2LZS2_9MICO|nr:TIM barrel protein [Microbacterium ulmi]NII69952.1 hydroxypyruvate isomerase [Microbacterium ulmi]NNH03871.1 TIM barrel protein [Microbacterium ulmi]